MYKDMKTNKKEEIQLLLQYINKYIINEKVFSDYEVLRKIQKINHYTYGNTNNIISTQQKAHKQTSTTYTVKQFNDNIISFGTNYLVLKHLYNHHMREQTKDKDTAMELFAKDINEQKNSIQFDFQAYKVKFCELFLTHSSFIKEIKLNPNKIYEKLVNKNYKNNYTNEYNFELDVFMSLLKMLGVNCIYISCKCSYIINNDASTTYYVILNNSETTITNNKHLKKYLNGEELLNTLTLINVPKEHYNEILHKTLTSTYVITDLKKPIKSIGGYKLGELQDISIKLGIIINKGNGKPKVKQEIYDECLNKIFSFI